MARIFIDANVYLEFFKTSDPSLRKHAEALAGKFKNEIFISKQLVDEVERNKVGVASRYLGEQLKRIDLPRISLPGFPRDLAERLESVAKDAAKLKKDGQLLARAYLKNLSAGTDETSQILSPVFATARHPGEEVLRRARDRKERGNPPGKSSDPLGDQITWEQFLEQVTHGPIWIITKDSDYLVKFDGLLHLNSFLQRELESRSPCLDVRVFEHIAAGLKDFEACNSEGSPPILTPADSAQAQQVERILDEQDWNDDRTICELCEPGEDRGPPLVAWSQALTPPHFEDPESLFDTGTCNWCNGTSIRCRSCGVITAVDEGRYDEPIECDGGCGFSFEFQTQNDGYGDDSIEIRVVTHPSK